MRPSSNRFLTALVILLIATLGRLIVATTLGISDDEAWYWAISKNLQASYVVHPPLIMWMLAVSTKIFGDTLFAVRLPSLILSTWGVYMLLRLSQKLGWEKGSHIVSLFCFLTPLLFLGGILTGPDLPLFAFWIASMTITYDVSTVQTKPPLTRWILLGICLGLSLLSKYTGVFAALAVAFSLLATTEGRKRLRTPGPYVSVLICGLFFLPVIFWNEHHKWSSFLFQMLDRHEGSDVSFKRWGVFWASQFLLYGPILIIGWFGLLKLALVSKTSASELKKIRFLAIWALLPGLLFFSQPLFSPFKIHWALFAYLPIAVFTAKLYLEYFRTRLLWTGFYFTAGLTAIGVLSCYAPVISSTSELFMHKIPDPKLDVTNDFYGWKNWAGYLHGRLSQEEMQLPILAARYQNAAQAAFSLHDKNKVLLIPHESYECRDWSGEQNPPEKFLYVVDNRYNDDPHSLYPQHHCQPALTYEKKRGGYLAKKIELLLCSKKTI